MENDAFRLETVLFHPFLGFPFLEPLARLARLARTRRAPCQLAVDPHAGVNGITLPVKRFADSFKAHFVLCWLLAVLRCVAAFAFLALAASCEIRL